MPAVHHPPGQTKSNITLTLVPADPLRLLFHIGVAVAVFFIFFALRCTIRVWGRDAKSTRQVTGLADQESRHQRYQPAGIWEKSRGVSRAIEKGMSPNQEPPVTEFSRVDDRHEHEDREGVSASPVEKVEEVREGGLNTKTMDMSTHQQHLRSRPPPPPPLTPPTLSTTTLTLEERRISAAVSVSGDIHSSFFHQPNPEYTSHSSSSSSAAPPNTGSPSTPRRRSYAKTLPLGPPQPVSFLEEDGSITPFSPSSFPSSSPILPLAPHDAFHTNEVDVTGEIVSVMDDSEAGWKRHTRVYGGGVCLACLASNGEGGFYGDRVRPEEKR
jgi:hypothetical protein